jgi:hypothetical protein
VIIPVVDGTSVIIPVDDVDEETLTLGFKVK